MTPIKKAILLANKTEFTRYFWAGSLVFLVDFTLLLTLTEFFGVNYLWSNLVAVSVGIVMSYLFCINWVFRNRLYNQIAFEFALFVMTCIVGIVLNEFMMWAFVELLTIHYLIAKIFVTLAVFLVNFCLKKIILFRKS